MPDIADELVADRKSSKPGDLPEEMPRWMAVPITWIDWFSYWIGMTVCWLTVPLFGAMVYEVIARYAFTAPTMWAYDISRMLYGALFMLGAVEHAADIVGLLIIVLSPFGPLFLSVDQGF